MSQSIKIDKIQVQVVSDSSGIFWGKNMQTGWKSVLKQNLGCGIVSGDANNLPSSVNMLNDPDIVDTMLTPTVNREPHGAESKGPRDQET